jgi:hypothetical protein
MFVACRLAGLSALEAHYAGLATLSQSGVRGSVQAPIISLDVSEVCSDYSPVERPVLVEVDWGRFVRSATKWASHP